MANMFGNSDSTLEECGVEWSTDCVIHNTTGHTIRFVCSKEWSVRKPHNTASYPSEIQNGQVVSFSNVKDTVGSAAGVVYRGNYCDHMMAWSNPWSADQNSVWTETREVDHYTDTEWETIRDRLTEPRTHHTDTWKATMDCESTIKITGQTSATVKAKFTSIAECGVEWSTDCFIHNTTGHTTRFFCSKEWSGYETPSYPSEIQNGQEASFLNVKNTIGSAAGVVYRGNNRDYMMAWSNPWSADRNSAWTETREVNHYTDAEWETIRDELTVPRTYHTDTWNESKDCVSRITITGETSATVKAKFTSNGDDDDA